MGLEKRKERRIKVSLPIKIIYQNTAPIASRTENISRLGAYVEIGKELPAGKEIEVILEIPAYDNSGALPQQIKCKGNIFRSAQLEGPAAAGRYGIGVFFTDFSSPADKDKLSGYIDYLIAQEDRAVKEGLKHWRDKRKEAKRKKYLEEGNEIKKANSLLKQILERLQEIKQSLGPREK